MDSQKIVIREHKRPGPRRGNNGNDAQNKPKTVHPIRRDGLESALAHAASEIWSYGRTVDVFTTDAVHLILDHKSIPDASDRIALFGLEEDTEILLGASENSRKSTGLPFKPNWLQCPESYNFDEEGRRALLEDAREQNWIIFESLGLKVYALPALFSVAFMSHLHGGSSFNDETMGFIASLLRCYLHSNGKRYLDIEELKEGPGKYCLQRPTERFYLELNGMYEGEYGTTNVIRNIPYDLH
ncbi:hypothetical protein EMPG_16487 [Blastomyces silverae]|uniref:Uncharacterized protein n=1 Tax=Blastomyces silverae TaxID=2060906 RepID=A0A0H1BAL8_9EURO|nr:hypothetical protein EMPG_16487 [Blastomyces silverae]